MNIRSWLGQPSTITGLGILGGAIAGVLSNLVTGNPTIDGAAALVVLILTHLGINDHSVVAQGAGKAALDIAVLARAVAAEMGRSAAAGVPADDGRTIPPVPATPASGGHSPVASLLGGLVVLALAGGLLAACSQPGPTGVAQAEVALTAAERAALVYVTLPHCPAAPAGGACSEASIVAKIKAADNVAYAAVKAAAAGTVAPQVALDAVTSLIVLIPGGGT